VDHPPTVSNAAKLLLCRLMIPAKSPPTDAAVRKDVQSIAGPIADPAWTTIEQELQSAGLVERPVGPPKRSKRATPPKVGPMRATESGRAAGMEFLGLTVILPKTTWKKLVSEKIFPAAVPSEARPPTGSTPAQSLAFFLAAELGVPPATTVKAVIERAALVQMGLPDVRGWDDVVRHFIGKKLDVELPPMSPGSLNTQVPRLVFKTATNPKPDQLRARALASWASTPVGGADAVADAIPTLRLAAEQAGTLGSFAKEVHAIAASTADGRFGTNKMFIARLWDHWPGDRPPLEQFKRMLVEAHRADLLTLSRADLISAMDPGDVARSETRYETAEFHFVLIEPGRAP
jgi:hypothetical protein